ncbi:MAG: ATP-binding protein [Bacteroidaceae bacterium]|nr:ATP-binding protein [Bacteroidaceae bacterium]
MSEYKRRIADYLLQEKLDGVGAVLIEGPKWCGKTTTAAQHAKSIVYLDDTEGTDWLQLASVNPKAVLDGAVPRLIDEWQNAPRLWDAVRMQVDRRGMEGQFILTGSAVPPDDAMVMHSGTGRFSWLMMRPMSLWESGESNGGVSLRRLFDRPDEIFATSELTLEDIAYLICRGGWPRATMQKRRVALGRAFDYYDAVVKRDISRVDGIRRDTERAKRIMRSYARHQGSQASINAIAADISAGDGSGIDEKTINSYLAALRKIFVIEDMAAWNPNLRSKTAIRTSDTRYFIDPSIATASLGLGPDDLLNDLNTLGLLFETMCVRDLRVFSEALGGGVYHYRDKSGLECDTVVHLRNGDYGLVEIKLGGQEHIEAGATSLKTLAAKIDTSRMKVPSFLMVLTAVGMFAYRREDGVYVVPVGTLKD